MKNEGGEGSVVEEPPGLDFWCNTVGLICQPGVSNKRVGSE